MKDKRIITFHYIRFYVCGAQRRLNTANFQIKWQQQLLYGCKHRPEKGHLPPRQPPTPEIYVSAM
jgi:hypothetical protein